MTCSSRRGACRRSIRSRAWVRVGCRIILYWHDVAPSPNSSAKPAFDAADPAGYDWSKYDPAIDEAKARGWPVLLTVSGPVPKWATLARRDTRTRPSPSEFTRFTEAVAKHYAGRVSQFSIWNEPNLPRFLLPQYFKGQVASPQWYRKLFFAGVRGLKRGGITTPSVLVGETAPRGTATAVAPLIFLRKTLCLSESYKRNHSCTPLPAAGYAHHPYTTQQGPFLSRPSEMTSRSGCFAGSSPHLTGRPERERSPNTYRSISPSSASSRYPFRTSVSANTGRLNTKRSPNGWPGTSRASRASRNTCCATMRRVRTARRATDTVASSRGFASPAARRSCPTPRSQSRSPRCARETTSHSGASPDQPKRRRRSTVLYGRTRFRTYKRYTTNSHGYFTRTVAYVRGRSTACAGFRPRARSIRARRSGSTRCSRSGASTAALTDSSRATMTPHSRVGPYR